MLDLYIYTLTISYEDTVKNTRSDNITVTRLSDTLHCNKWVNSVSEGMDPKRSGYFMLIAALYRAIETFFAFLLRKTACFMEYGPI